MIFYIITNASNSDGTEIPPNSPACGQVFFYALNFFRKINIISSSNYFMG